MPGKILRAVEFALSRIVSDRDVNVSGAVLLRSGTQLKTQDEVADRIATRINSVFGALGSNLVAENLSDGFVRVYDSAGSLIHTVDATGIPAMGLSGAPLDPEKINAAAIDLAETLLFCSRPCFVPSCFRNGKL